MVRTSSRNLPCSCCLAGSVFIRHYFTCFAIPADNEISEARVYPSSDLAGPAQPGHDAAVPAAGSVQLARRIAGQLPRHAGVVSSRRLLVSLLAHCRHGFLGRLQRFPAQRSIAAGIFRPPRLSVDRFVELLAARAAQPRHRSRLITFGSTPGRRRRRLRPRLDRRHAGRAGAVAYLRHGLRVNVLIFATRPGARLAHRRLRRVSAGVLRRHGDGNAHSTHRAAGRRLFYQRAFDVAGCCDARRAMVAAGHDWRSKPANYAGAAEQDSVLVIDLRFADSAIAVRPRSAAVRVLVRAAPG